jgi:hypothetical protein
MSTTAPNITPIPRSREPDQLPIVPEPKTMGEAIKHLSTSSGHMARVSQRLERLLDVASAAPEWRPVNINQAPNTGLYIVTDKSPWPAKSIGVLNPTVANGAAVFVSTDGTPPRPGVGVPFVPAGGVLILPVEARDVQLGCDPTVLLANPLTVWLFRYVTLQPLSLTAG